MMKRFFIGVILLLALASFCACAAAPAVNTNQDEITRKLDALDVYRKTVPTPVHLDASMFRKAAYGWTRAQVMDAETLELLEEYTDALDYEYIQMFSYQMIPTYWFNEEGLLFRGSYYMQSEVLFETIEVLYAKLKSQFGEATETGYYSVGYSQPVYYDTEQQGSDALSSGEAYYYIWFDRDTDIEVYVRIAADGTSNDTPIYDFYVSYTDYTYYDD